MQINEMAKKAMAISEKGSNEKTKIN